MINYLLEMNETARRYLLGSLFFLSFGLTVYTGTWICIILTFFFAGLFIYVNDKYIQIYHKKLTDSLPSALQKYNYEADETYLSFDFVSGLAINYDGENIAIAQRKHRDDEFKVTTLPFSSIIESELREDNETLMKTSKGSTIGGALVGGVLAGGVGAIVGGMTGSKTGKEKAKKLTLIMVTDDIRNPVYEINFINDDGLGVDKSSPLYEDSRSKATKWHKTISVILNKNKLNTSSI